MASGVPKIRREPCAKCNLPVFIAERLNVGKRLYHRTCFRCDRCNSQLTLANYYETENNQYCCEICPDEEQHEPKQQQSSTTTSSDLVLTRSLSDEEKSINMKNTEITNEFDDYSTKFETALEFPDDNTLKQDSTLTRNARFFINSQIDRDNDDDDDDVDDDSNVTNDPKPPDLPKTPAPSKSDLTRNYISSNSDSLLNINDNNSNNNDNNNNNNDRTDKLVNSDDDNIVTKDTDEGDLNVSLVKSRMLLFENQMETAKKSENNIIVPSIKSTNNENKKESFDNTIITIPDDSLIKTNLESSIDTNNDDSIIVISSGDDTVLDNSKQNLSHNLDKTNVIDDQTKPIDYPDDLNPFGDDDNKSTDTTKASLNPFDEDDDDDVEEIVPKPRTRRKISPNITNDISLHTERISLNPFENEANDNMKKTPQPAIRRVLQAPKISLTPFWNDDNDESKSDTTETPQPAIRSKFVESTTNLNPFCSDDDDNDNTIEKPIPKPRQLKTYSGDGSESLSSLSSAYSTAERKKKKPAPRPPNSEASSLNSTPSHSITQATCSTPKLRKNRKAPLPPTSDNDKLIKDEMNRTKQNESILINDKSTYGKWKRRKGQAPQRPIPQRRTIKSLPINDIKHELDLIEIQQQGLEKQGVRLEQIIRDKCETDDSNIDQPLSSEVDDLILQLFELVNEKNELFRKQTELMYLRRQHRLEEEHADVEYQIRCLMLQPETSKTDSDKAKEEELIKRLVEIVERRNEIIECLEMDRVREAEEDDCINNQLILYTSKKDAKSTSKENKKKLKKKFKLKNSKTDIDKDIDECEEASPTSSSSSKIKEKKKKKFNIF